MGAGTVTPGVSTTTSGKEAAQAGDRTEMAARGRDGRPRPYHFQSGTVGLEDVLELGGADLEYLEHLRIEV